MSVFEEAFAYAFSVLEEFTGESVVFRYNGIETPIVAIPAREDGTETITGGRTSVANRSLNWLIDASKLVVSGNTVKPTRGNEIIRSDGRCYRVFAPNQGPAWQWAHGYEGFIEVQTIEYVPKT